MRESDRLFVVKPETITNSHKEECKQCYINRLYLCILSDVIYKNQIRDTPVFHHIHLLLHILFLKQPRSEYISIAVVHIAQ